MDLASFLIARRVYKYSYGPTLGISGEPNYAAFAAAFSSSLEMIGSASVMLPYHAMLARACNP